MANVVERVLRHVWLQPEGCWDWTGHVMDNGYGLTRDGVQRRTTAHRVVYEALVGPIPEGMQLDHLCRNRRCVNPAHLEPVSQAENMRRAAVLKTHCVRGHALTADNAYWQSKGAKAYRSCLACRRSWHHRKAG